MLSAFYPLNLGYCGHNAMYLPLYDHGRLTALLTLLSHPRFTLSSAFYPLIRVLPSHPRFTLISVFYPLVRLSVRLSVRLYPRFTLNRENMPYCMLGTVPMIHINIPLLKYVALFRGRFSGGCRGATPKKKSKTECALYVSTIVDLKISVKRPSTIS